MLTYYSRRSKQGSLFGRITTDSLNKEGGNHHDKKQKFCGQRDFNSNSNFAPYSIVALGKKCHLSEPHFPYL